VVSFPQVSPPKPCTRLYSPPDVLHAPPISFFSNLIIQTILSEEYRSLMLAWTNFLKQTSEASNVNQSQAQKLSDSTQ
jgi:hypothetical protein